MIHMIQELFGQTLRARPRTSESGGVGFCWRRDSLWSREAISFWRDRRIGHTPALRGLAPVLDERGRRRFAAAEATSAGHGGIIAVMRATGIARSTIGRGLAELRAGETPDLERVGRVGGGRRPLSETDANLLDEPPARNSPTAWCPPAWPRSRRRASDLRTGHNPP